MSSSEKDEKTGLPLLDRPPKGDKIALVKFDGTAITEQGNVVKHNWFKGLDFDPDAYTNVLLTPSEAQALKAAHQRTKTGASSASIMICLGADRCPIADSCPLVRIQRDIDRTNEKRNVMPIGGKCPIELGIMKNAIEKIAEEFEITDEPGNYTDQRIALELAEIEVLEHRMNSILATNYQDFSEQKLMLELEDEQGTRRQYIKDIADVAKMKEKLWTRKDKLRKELVATRYEQRKMNAKEGERGMDISNMQAAILKRLSMLQAEVVKGEK